MEEEGETLRAQDRANSNSNLMELEKAKAKLAEIFVHSLLTWRKHFVAIFCRDMVQNNISTS